MKRLKSCSVLSHHSTDGVLCPVLWRSCELHLKPETRHNLCHLAEICRLYSTSLVRRLETRLIQLELYLFGHLLGLPPGEAVSFEYQR